ncbi:MAG: hypothetical protein VKL39_06345 [Leptolyngbyaceae bacterium]|nr:hypothetical protein [Leptolyngbyaceae bacterium]
MSDIQQLPLFINEFTTEIDQLRQRFIALSEVALPQKAKDTGHYPVRYDHCFKRIALDVAVHQCWYDVIQKPAIRHATAEQLQRAIATLEMMLDSPDEANRFNQISLGFRKRRNAEVK